MARPQMFGTNPDREFMSLVTEVVTNWRNRGFTRERAKVLAAEELDLRLRRVQAVEKHDPIVVAVAEYDAAKRRYRDHLKSQEDHLMEKLEAVRAKSRQLDLGL